MLGEVGGQVAELTEAPSTGGFSQQSNPPGPHFRIPNATSEDDEQLVVVYLTWEKAVANGEVTPSSDSSSSRAGRTVANRQRASSGVAGVAEDGA